MAIVNYYATAGHGNGGTLFPTRSNFSIIPPTLPLIPGYAANCFKGFSSPLSSSSNFFLTDFNLPVSTLGEWASLTVHIKFTYYNLIGNFLGVPQPSTPPQPMFLTPGAQIAVGAHLIDAFGFGPHKGPDIGDTSSIYAEGTEYTWEYTWSGTDIPDLDTATNMEVGGTYFSTLGCNVQNASPPAPPVPGAFGDYDVGQYAYIQAYPWFTVTTVGSYCYGYRGTYSPSFGA